MAAPVDEVGSIGPAEAMQHQNLEKIERNVQLRLPGDDGHIEIHSHITVDLNVGVATDVAIVVDRDTIENEKVRSQVYGLVSQLIG